MLVETWPPFSPEQPEPSDRASITAVLRLAAAITVAADNPVYPPPMMTTSADAGSRPGGLLKLRSTSSRQKGRAAKVLEKRSFAVTNAPGLLLPANIGSIE
jgi:hypothetical protein